MRTVQGYGLLLLLLVAGIGADWSGAQGFPTKPVRIQTSGAGGGTDFVSRLIAGEINGPLGQQVVVENVSSASMLASGVAKAAPDGYTLMLIGPGMWIGPLFTPAPYDAARDFAGVAKLTQSPSVLVVTASLPVKTVADLIRLAKAKPGTLNYSTGATGGSPHLAGALLVSMADADIVRVAYKGGAAEVADIISGQVHMSFGSGATWGVQIKSGKVRAIATSGSRRSVAFPDLPTVAETVPGYVSEAMFGLFAPAKTPDAIVRRLNQETVRAIEKPDVQEKLMRNGQEAASAGPPEQLMESVRAEIARIDRMIKDGVIKPGS